jgi:prevent-host-death family protein
MKISVTEIRDSLSDALNRVAYGGERVIVERRGKNLVALISMDDLARLEELENQSDVKAAKKALKEKGSVPLAKVKQRLGLK